MKDQGREISDFLTSYSQADDAEIDDELDALEAAMVGDNLPKISENGIDKINNFLAKQPEKTVHIPTTQSKTKNDELELNEWLN